VFPNRSAHLPSSIFYLPTRIEHSRTFRVEGTMEQVRVILVSLLPAFWLVASDSCSAGAAADGADGSGGSLVSACAHGKKGPLQDALALDQRARNSTRRLVAQPGRTGFTPAFVSSDFQLSRFEPVGLFFAVAEAPPDLAGCWQFYWRTALEPRAPSSVS